MNRFAATGLFIEAAKGQRILVITPRQHEIGDALDCFMRIEDVATWPGVRARRANGSQRIDLGGRGHIVFHSASSHLQGMSADIVYIDDEADRRLEDSARDRLYADLCAVVSGSSTGDIVRA